MSNKRIELTRRVVGGLTGGRGALSLSAVRWKDGLGCHGNNYLL